MKGEVREENHVVVKLKKRTRPVIKGRNFLGTKFLRARGQNTKKNIAQGTLSQAK